MLLWDRINQLNIDSQIKNKLFIGMFILINLVLGGVLWCIAGQYIFPGMEGLFCFMGYPAVFIGFFGGMIYLYNQMR